MANPIKNEQLIEGLKEVISLIDAFTEKSKTLAKSLSKAVDSFDFGDTKDAQKINLILEELVKISADVTDQQKARTKATEELTKQEKELNKILDQSKEFNKDLAVEIEKVKIQRSAARKEAKAQAQQQLNLNTTYDQQRAKLNELTKTLINLRLEGKQGTKAFQEQEEEFKKLFKAVKNAEEEFGRYQRS